MVKESFINSAADIQNRLWGKICGENTVRLDKRGVPVQTGLTKRIELARRGHLPNGLSITELSGDIDRFSALLGDFAPRVIMASNPNNPTCLLPEQVAVAGGWCALRTKDVINLSQQGIIADPYSGTLKEVRSVDQVADWIRNAVSFDQIVESIGAVNAAERIVISEQRLWTERVITKLSVIFGRPLSLDERATIRDSIESSEKKRATMTERYLKIATGKENLNFRQIVDGNIWQDLKYARADMLSRVGLSAKKLQVMFPDDAESIPASAIVWTMYSEPYFDVLRNKGKVSKKTVFVVEPSIHTYADTRPGNEVVQRIYQDKGKYFDPKGMNANTGFIAFMECITPNGLNVRKNLTMGEVPNIANWERLLNADGILDPEKNAIINVKDNLLFVWGTNLLPFGQTRQSLLSLAELQDEFLSEKGRIGGSYEEPYVKQRQVAELREKFIGAIIDQNQRISLELRNLFAYLTSGL